jgi:hypothetical protein
MLRRVFWWILSDVSEELELTASSIRAMRLHGATSQKTVIFILVAVRI